MIDFPFSTPVLDIIAQGNIKAFYAVRLDFGSEIVRAHTSTGTYVINGETYLGVGNFGTVGSAEESTGAQSPHEVELTLSGLDDDLVQNLIITGCRGKQGRLMFCVVNEAGNMAADILISGRMDAARLTVGAGNNNKITVALVDRLAEWKRGGSNRWTDENHGARNQVTINGVTMPDRFFAPVAQMEKRPIYWGAAKDAPGFVYTERL